LIKLLISDFRTKVGHSDPITLCGKVIAYQIKETPGITALSFLRVLIDGTVCDLDVGSSYPGAAAGPKGPGVHRLKWYVSWV
jgi:hypothetical protein